MSVGGGKHASKSSLEQQQAVHVCHESMCRAAGVYTGGVTNRRCVGWDVCAGSLPKKAFQFDYHIVGVCSSAVRAGRTSLKDTACIHQAAGALSASSAVPCALPLSLTPVIGVPPPPVRRTSSGGRGAKASTAAKMAVAPSGRRCRSATLVALVCALALAVGGGRAGPCVECGE